MERERPRSSRVRFARTLRGNQTDAERKLWSFLRMRQLAGHKFRRQHSIGPYTVDFCCPRESLVVELDGGQHAEQRERDARRTSSLKSRGYRVLRFWDHEVLSDMEAVTRALLANLERRPGRQSV